MSMISSRDSLSDDEFDSIPQAPSTLLYDDDQLKSTALSRLNTLRKGSHFCDVTFQVGTHSLQGHRAVLACSSVYLYERFCEEEQAKHQFVELDVDYDSFDILMDYVYTARLSVPEDQVQEVYQTARMLKMERVAEQCAYFMIEHLTPANCLGIRSFAHGYCDQSLTQKTDIYISDNILSILSNSEVHKLPNIEVKVMGVTEEDEITDHQLCHLVVNFFKPNIENMDDLDFDVLMENPPVLYLRSDGSLLDCMEVTDPTMDHSDIVLDYKHRNKLISKTPGKSPEVTSRPLSTVPSNNRAQNSNGLTTGLEDQEWGVVATAMVADQRFTCVAVLADQLVALNIKLYPHPQPLLSPEDPEPTVAISPRASPPGEKMFLRPSMSSMMTARCGHGTAVLGDNLVALGGYDRGECLNSVELYDVEVNAWSALPPMLTPRGRFDVSQIQGKLYACGGSNGSEELKSAECYDLDKQEWTDLPDMSTCRSSAGVAAVDDKLYVIGGWSGYAGIKSCEVFTPKTGTWEPMTGLNTGRSQCAVAAYQGKLYAVGGSNAWNSTNTVEMYDMETDKWKFLVSMTTCRRGAGVAVFKDKLYVVGGSDGQQSLSTVEIFDPVTSAWSFGPPMCTPRANVTATVVGNMLFAVGGFSGKMFLDTIECLSEDDTEWSGQVPRKQSNELSNGLSNGCHGDGYTEHVFRNGIDVATENNHEKLTGIRHEIVT